MHYFPNISNFDISIPGGMALYLAHCDIDPIWGLIEHTEAALSDTVNQYINISEAANEIGDFYSHSSYIDLVSIFQSRIIPLSYQSIILILMSRVEEAFKTWCRIIKRNKTDILDLKDYKHARRGFLDKQIAYLEEYACVQGIKADPLWDYISAVSVIRNAIIHCGGRVQEEKGKRKLERFGFGLVPEDNSVYLEMNVIKEIYKKVVEFIDRVFMIAPTEKL